VLAFERNLAFDIAASWQARSLSFARGTTRVVLMSVLAHTYDAAMEALLCVVFPGFTSIIPPFLCTAGKIDKTGAIVADVVMPDGVIVRDTALYLTELELRNDFRRLADRLKLSDPDRIEMFKCVQAWVVADRRLDPTFDRMDPDAKRRVH
jgi:hypothetical protein